MGRLGDGSQRTGLPGLNGGETAAAVPRKTLQQDLKFNLSLNEAFDMAR